MSEQDLKLKTNNKPSKVSTYLKGGAALLVGILASHEALATSIDQLDAAFDPVVKSLATLINKYAPAAIFIAGVGGAGLAPGGGDLRARATSAGVAMTLALVVVLVSKKWLVG